MRRAYAPPGDRLVLTAEDAALHALAARLWEEGAKEAGALLFEIATFDGPAPAPEAERQVRWSRDPRGYRLTLGALADLRIDLAPARVSGRISGRLVSDEPGLAARYALEAPAAALLCRRGWQALHAGAVVGPKGAVVLRGPAGAGKSTLVAALHAAGFGVLADESLLVSRTDRDDLAAAVRDLTLLSSGATLLGLGDATRFAFTGDEEKRRIDLFAGGSPAARRARLAAAVLLGDRDRTPAALVPLGAEEFAAAFREGEIPQERDGADPDAVACAWGARAVFRLDGARDLMGAVTSLVALLV
ncbi:MAG TPA: hypothetical protein PLB02_09610 [Thermoanaerobaculia bacterium]|nr:hypothetical protein [Thermoanaerobaculia bacterium]